MTIKEQAAIYEAGVKANLKTGYMGKVDWSSRHADALEDYMALEALFTPDDGEVDARRSAYKERGVMLMREMGDQISSADWFGPEVTVQGYAAADAEWSMRLFERWNKAKRLAAQRPLIHNGRKMKR